MEIQICENCQSPLADNDKFCPNCGLSQDLTSNKIKKCQKCAHENLFTAAFCENCGASIKEMQLASEFTQSDPNKIVSQGNYSGTMTKSKSTFRRRLWYAVLIIVALGAIGLIIWFQLDPNAGEKLTNFAVGLGFVAVFVFFIFRAAKKGKYKGKRRGLRSIIHDDYDNDYDDDGYDDNEYDDDDD